MVKFAHLISKEAENKKCHVKYLFWKHLKKLYKTIKESISSNVTDLIYSKSNQKALGHLRHSKSTWALKALYLADSSLEEGSLLQISG